MKHVRVYSTRVCPYCMMAKRFLERKGVPYEEVLLDQNPALRAEIINSTGHRTVPQIFVGDTFIGGFNELSALDRAGDLDPLLASDA